MGMNLLEAMKLAPDMATAAIIEQYARSSDILAYLPFRNIEGSGEHYNLEEKMPGVGFRGLNEGFEHSAGVLNPQSEALKTAGGDLKVDRAIVDQQGSSARAAHVMLKVKALALAWTKAFIKGDSRVNPRVFDGMQVRFTGSQLIDNAADGAALSLNKLDEAIDAVDDPFALALPKALRRRLTQAGRNTSVGGHIEYDVDQFGRKVVFYQGLRLLEVDYDNTGKQIMPFTESSADGSSLDCNSIYVMSFGDMMISGIQGNVNGRPGIAVKDLGEMESEPSYLTRVEWDNAVTVKHGRAGARLRGIKDAPVVV